MDVQDAAARQADGERIIIAHAVPLESRETVVDHLLGQHSYRTIDTCAGDRADDCAVGVGEH